MTSDSKLSAQLLASLSANDIIREIKPVVIPRISAVTHIAMCERLLIILIFWEWIQGTLVPQVKLEAQYYESPSHLPTYLNQNPTHTEENSNNY